MTYSQCSGEKEILLKFLDGKVSISKYVIAKENHKDGGTHFHVYLELDRSADIKNPRFFDWNEYHPKFESVKSVCRVTRYCKKNGDYITNMTFDTFQKARDLAKDGDIEGALNVIMDEQPKEIVNLDRWERNLKRVAQLSRKSRNSHINKRVFEFKKLCGIDRWDRKKKTLVIHGQSGWGKTQYVKSLFKNPLMVRHIDKLKQFDEWKYDGIIFDDMSFSHWPREACIHLLDIEEDADINVKCSMVSIPAGTPRVIIHNCPETGHPSELFAAFDLAIRRRHFSIEVKEDLRKLPGAAMLLAPGVEQVQPNDSDSTFDGW